MSPQIKACHDAIEKLKNSDNWSWDFVNLKIDFMRNHAPGFIFSTVHGIDFFKNVITYSQGGYWDEEGEGKPRGELGNNFRAFIKQIRLTK